MKIKASLILMGILSTLPSLGLSQAKIVGGTNVGPGVYPWMAAMVRSANPSNAFQSQYCGGSLIHESWVVTAAHCVEGESASQLGVWLNITDLDDTSQAVYRGVKAIFRHPSYREDGLGNLQNDIALLLLDSPVNSVTPIAYARGAGTTPVGTTVRAIGWGDTESTPRYPTNLKQADLVLRSITEARRSYGSTLDNRHLSASRSGHDTCQGDSGGPLFETDGDGGAPLLVGITSFGLGCADGPPGIYTNVGFYAGWLNTFLKQPTDLAPHITVRGLRGRTVPDGRRSISRADGTYFGGPVRGGRSRIRSFSILNAAGSWPLSINNIVASGRPFSVIRKPSYAFGSGRAVTRIRFRAPNRSRVWRSTVRVFSSDPNNRIYSFRILARSRRHGN